MGVELDPARARAARALEGSASARVYDRVEQRDLIADPFGDSRLDLVISNPPFSHAEDFARAAMKLVRPGGVVAFLLRLGWLASQSRVAFHRDYPSDVYVLPKRPSFNNKGTDSADYAWLLWGLGRGGRWSLLDVDSGTSGERITLQGGLFDGDVP